MKARYWFTLSLIAAGFAACSRESLSTDNGFPTGHAHIVDETTRTVFDNVTGKLSWSEGDRIALHLSDGTYAEAAVAENGIFRDPAPTGNPRDFYAVYPAAIATTEGYPDLYVSLPDNYDWKDNTDGSKTPSPMIAVNSSDNSDLYFRHVGGLLRITCDAVPAGTKQISVTADHNICGLFAVADAATGHPSIGDGGTGRTVTFTVSDEGLAADTDGIILNLPVPVGTYSRFILRSLDGAGGELGGQIRNISFDIPRHGGKKLRFGTSRYSLTPLDDILISGEDVLRSIPFTFSVTTEKDDTDGMQGASDYVGWTLRYLDGNEPQPVPGYDISGDSAYQTQPIDGQLEIAPAQDKGDGLANPFSFTVRPVSMPGEGIDWDASPSAKSMYDLMKDWPFEQYVLDLSRWSNIFEAILYNKRKPETANCYILMSSGSYQIPLVYGNAIKEGEPNPEAYSAGGTVPSGNLAAFVNADGAPVSSPYILTDLGLKVDEVEAFVLWQDVRTGHEILLDEDFFVNEYPVGSDRVECPHIQFKVRKDRVMPGNAVIALRRKSDGKILWSWHLWLRIDMDADECPSILNEEMNRLKERTLTYLSDLSVTPSPTANIKVQSIPLGWTPPISYKGGTSETRSQWVVFTDAETLQVIGSFKVTQEACTLPDVTATEYSCPLYQWGRKDPFLPVCDNGSTHVFTSAVLGLNEISSASNPTTLLCTGDGSADGADTPAGRLAWMISHPNVYYGNASTYPDIPNLWDMDCPGWEQDSRVVKTIYDPSPRGFCAPRWLTFTGFTEDGHSAETSSKIYGTWTGKGSAESYNTEWPSGYRFSLSHSASTDTHSYFIPCNGIRGTASEPASGGLTGAYWTGGANGKALRFQNGSVNPYDNYSRTNGFGFIPAQEID